MIGVACSGTAHLCPLYEIGFVTNKLISKVYAGNEHCAHESQPPPPPPPAPHLSPADSWSSDFLQGVGFWNE